MKELLLISITLITLVTHLEGYPNFQDRIPNGNRVPYPCKPNIVWYGVGHKNSKGGGVRNVFGEDFAKWGYEWNICLCQEDSDGDGRTNGEELGDPECVWTVGQPPERTLGLTHPGICDPFDGAQCAEKNKWVDCSKDSDFKCDAMKEPDVKNFTLTFDRTAVPSQETTYICQAFDIAKYLSPVESHLIGIEAKIDNKQVMHHAIVYGCKDDGVSAQTALDQYASPKVCDMGDSSCQDIIALWTVGIEGQCFNENFGFLLGGSGYKVLIMEFHWNNPEQISGYTDASEILFSVKTNKRENDGGVWFVGPPSLIIPPGYQNYSVLGGCSGLCTDKMLEKPIYLTDIIPHMHYLGYGFKFQQFRDGKKIYELVIERYLYDDPSIEYLDTPLEVRPGDELKLECIFQSKDRKKVTYYGESTQAEMCFAILIYYPQTPTVSYCATNQGYGFCNDTIDPNPLAMGFCDYGEFQKVVEEDYTGIISSCDVNGLQCKDDCKATVDRVKNHGCLNTVARDLVRYLYSMTAEGQNLLGSLASCEPRPASITTDSPGNKQNVCDIKRPVGGSSPLTSELSFVVMLGFEMISLILMLN